MEGPAGERADGFLYAAVFGGYDPSSEREWRRIVFQHRRGPGEWNCLRGIEGHAVDHQACAGWGIDSREHGWIDPEPAS